MSLNISGKGLTTLVGIDFPPNITHLDCFNNQLTTLEGAPSSLITLYCSDNQLTTLKGVPSSLKRLCCNNNKLTTLKGCPNSLQLLFCSNNKLTTLKGAPSTLRVLFCNGNQLTTLEGIPIYLQELYCRSNRLTTLEGLPFSCTGISYGISNIPEYSVQELDQLREQTYRRNVKQGITILNRIFHTRLHYLIYNLWHSYWYDQRDDKGHSRACKDVARQLVE